MHHGARLRLAVVLAAVVLVAVLAAGCTLNIPSGSVAKSQVTPARPAVSYTVPAGDPTVPAPVQGSETAGPVANASAGATTVQTGQPETASTVARAPAAVIGGGTAEATAQPTAIGGGITVATTPTTYPTPIGGGTHEVTITTTATTIAVSTSPTPACTVDFTGTPTSGKALLTVTFTSLNTCYVQKRTWNFGDGEVIGEVGNKVETHTYTQPGTYTVTLIEKMSTGESDFFAHTETKTGYITVTAASSGTVNPNVVANPPKDLKVNPDLLVTTTPTPTTRTGVVVKQPTNLPVNPDLIVTPKISLAANVPIMPANPQI